jgi:hypothetical protein
MLEMKMNEWTDVGIDQTEHIESSLALTKAASSSLKARQVTDL